MLLFIPIDIAKDGASPEILHAIVTNALLLQGTGISSALWLNFPSWSISAEFGAYVVFTLITLWLGSRMLPWLMIAVVGAVALVLLSPNRMDSTPGHAAGES